MQPSICESHELKPRAQSPEPRTSRISRSGEVAARYLVGGVNSPVRAFRKVGAAPLMLAGGSGSTVIDPGGRRYTDFIMGWGALILGHNHPAVVKAVRRAVGRGAPGPRQRAGGKAEHFSGPDPP